MIQTNKKLYFLTLQKNEGLNTPSNIALFGDTRHDTLIIYLFLFARNVIGDQIKVSSTT